MNTRSCERVNGLAVVLRGYLSMVGELAGDQWNEGDVSCSVVRRVALPDAFFAADGLFETFLTVLDEFGAFPAVDRSASSTGTCRSSTTTKVLMAAVRQRRRPRGRPRGDQGARGRGRAARCARRARSATTSSTGWPPTTRLGLAADQLDALVAEPLTFTGAAVRQVDEVVRRVEQLVAANPEAARYRPAPIL